LIYVNTNASNNYILAVLFGAIQKEILLDRMVQIFKVCKVACCHVVQVQDDLVRLRTKLLSQTANRGQRGNRREGGDGQLDLSNLEDAIQKTEKSIKVCGTVMDNIQCIDRNLIVITFYNCCAPRWTMGYTPLSPHIWGVSPPSTHLSQYLTLVSQGTSGVKDFLFFTLSKHFFPPPCVGRATVAK